MSAELLPTIKRALATKKTIEEILDLPLTPEQRSDMLAAQRELDGILEGYKIQVELYEMFASCMGHMNSTRETVLEQYLTALLDLLKICKTSIPDNFSKFLNELDALIKYIYERSLVDLLLTGDKPEMTTLRFGIIKFIQNVKKFHYPVSDSELLPTLKAYQQARLQLKGALFDNEIIPEFSILPPPSGGYDQEETREKIQKPVKNGILKQAKAQPSVPREFITSTNAWTTELPSSVKSPPPPGSFEPISINIINP